MRADSLGFFWADLPPPPKEKKENEKRVPPKATWLADDYLPGLDEALRFPIDPMTDIDIMVAQQVRDPLMLDVECYEDYFCAVFRSYNTGKTIVFEKIEGMIGTNDDEKFRWMMENCLLVTFNGINYDIPIISLALDGMECDGLKQATKDLIENGIAPWVLMRSHKVKLIKCDHIDLIEVAPLRGSLKTYGGRLHVPRMQDLPFHPNVTLGPMRAAIVRWYCVNDTTSTAFLFQCLQEQVKLRYTLSEETGLELRSKSDAQIAEQIIGQEYERRTGRKAHRPKIEPGTSYYYEKPYSLNFQTELLKNVLVTVQSKPFIVGEDGYIITPQEVMSLKVEIGQSVYQMGVGGLHSMEKSTAHYSDAYWQLIDKDVASYYPKIILNNGYFPEHLGQVFLEIFGGITDRRLRAKAAKQKAIADSLKIVINGTFGKLGSVWSIVYAPKLMFHTTIGGQLFLLMLIEAYELAGIRVVSANTDGVMIKCPRHLLPTLDAITKWWEGVTGFETEGENYRALYSRDVNNYIAISEKGTIKKKGAYSNPWADEAGSNLEKKLHKNPVTTICIRAVEKFLADKIPIEQTIYQSIDIKEFIRIQSVTGGAVKVYDESHTEFLGKAIRWYYAKDQLGEIVYAKNGNKVPKSDGGKPLMQLPNHFPNDVDHEWYIQESKKILRAIGAVVADDL